MRTRIDLITKVLDLLNVTQAGQDPAEEDVQKVSEIIEPKFSELARRQILYVQDPDAIDDEYFLPLAKIIANAVAPDFGTPYDDAADLREESRLRDINRSPAVFDTLRTEFF